MDLSTIWYTVQDLFQPFVQARGQLKPYMFNIYLQMVDSDLLMQHLRMKFNPSSNITGNQEQMDVLQKFKKSVSVDSSTSQALPSGYVRFIGALDDAVEVDYVDMDEYYDRKSNALTAPSTDYPVLYITNDTIVTDPLTIGTYTMWYYGENTGVAKPLFVFKAENSINVYDSASSVEVLWPEYMYPQIVMMILKYMGISINDPNVVQEKLKEIANAS